MKKCSDKKEIKKSPESAIATFFAIEDFRIEELAMIKSIFTLNIAQK
jgi:hypothetical protein